MSESPTKRLRTSSPARNAESQIQSHTRDPLETASISIPASNKPKPTRPARGNASKDADPILSSSSPYMPMFQTFRAELDAHHDRRERVIKTSRDVTATAKKMIFTLQRTPTLGSALPQNISSDLSGKESSIAILLQSIHPRDLQGINLWRYQRQISPGMQEYMEAAVFRHYLATGKLLSFDEASGLVAGLLVLGSKAEGVEDANGVGGHGDETLQSSNLLTVEDYILGIFDAVGEMMRWGITHLALTRAASVNDNTTNPTATTNTTTTTTSNQPSSSLITDLQSLRLALETLKTTHSGVDWEVGKKMEVMRACVEKVEVAGYGLVVRGSERPSGWVPSAQSALGGDGREAVEV